jgi:hypothetical protein
MDCENYCSLRAAARLRRGISAPPLSQRPNRGTSCLPVAVKVPRYMGSSRVSLTIYIGELFHGGDRSRSVQPLHTS